MEMYWGAIIARLGCGLMYDGDKTKANVRQIVSVKQVSASIPWKYIAERKEILSSWLLFMI